MLRYTSCLFATVPIHAYACGVPSYMTVFALVTVLSIAFHSTGDDCIGIIDMVVAHAAFIFVMLDSSNAISTGQPELLLFPVAVFVLWVAEGVFPWQDKYLHAALHVTAALGANIYIYCLHSKCTLGM